MTFDLLLFQFSGNAQFLVCRKQQKYKHDCIFICIKLERTIFYKGLKKENIVEILFNYYYTIDSIQDIEDIDYTTSTTSLSAHWTGFFHVYIDVDFKFRVGTRPGGGDVFPETDVGKNQTFTATGLTLDNFKVSFINH